MITRMISPTCVVVAAVAFLAVQPARAQSADTSFFLTSVGIGNGGNLGGLPGADNHCQTLAQAAGFGAPKTWRAYLSTQAADGAPAVNARDRIGKGPWKNVKGVVIAKDVADLHSPGNNLTKQTALSEKGERSQRPRRHAESPRRADGIASRWHSLCGRRRPHLQELDELDARLRDARSFRPARLGRRRCVEVVEFLASLARPRRRLLAGGSQDHRRRWLAVLFCSQLTNVLMTRIGVLTSPM